MSDTSVTEFGKQVEQIAQYSGNGTELVSVYLPPDASIYSMRERIASEISEAQNIKSKSTRKNVKTALSSVESVLQSYEEVPENGLVVFSGVVETENGSEEKTIVLDSLPFPISSQLYHCGSEFRTELIEGLGEESSVYAILLIDRNNAAIGRMTNTFVETITTFSSPVPGKQKKGGQSQARFERLRLEAIDNHYQKLAEKANEIFVGERHSIDGLLVGGPEITRSEFIDCEYLHHELQDKIVYEGSVTSVDESGIEELSENASGAIDDAELVQKKDTCEEFFKKIANNLATYGEDSVRTAVEYGAVDVLLISESYYPSPPENIESLIELAEDYGGSVEVMPTSFAKGEQFSNGFGGVGAILRYEIN